MGSPLFSKKMSIVIDGSTLLCPTDFTLDKSKDMIEIACMSGTGAKQSIPDLYSWTVSFSGTVYTTAGVDAGAYSYEALSKKFKTDASVAVYILPDVSANYYETGWGYISSISFAGGVGAPVTYSGEITGSSELTDASTA